MVESKFRVDVSSEMLSFIGDGVVPAEGWPDDSLLLSFAGIGGDAVPILHFDPRPAHAGDCAEADVVIIVQRAACRRIFGGIPANPGTWHMPSVLRALAIAIRDCQAEPAARPTLQLARSIELLCQAFAEMAKGALVPAQGGAQLSEMDAARIAAARRMIDERWHEKLTLDGIARACGINRDKLSRGFRATYDTTVADLIAEKRLSGAHGMLLATDLAVATIGYRCGYLNNASFTRAFTRRFGVAPSLLRQRASGLRGAA